ncbi:MAG: IreB family regulatory phosphoprotein [Ruminococcaceae bacterium]|nr:IreB family regulatory phosphoprotein [Oscillospiraceae bacterium]
MTEQPHAKTQKFSLHDDKNQEMHAIVAAVYQALREKGYDPINQLVGYILSEDPTYITNHKSARALICRIDRDELMRELVKTYLGI